MAVIGGGIARAVIRAALPSLIRDGITGAASISHFASWGYGIRKQDFYGIFRDVSAKVENQDIVKGFDKFKPIPLKSFEKTELNLSKKYLYDVEFEVYDEHGNYVDDKVFSYSTDSRLEPAEVEEIMTYIANEKYPDLVGWSFTDATLVGALKK